MATSYRVTVADLWPGLYTWVSVPPEPFSDPFPLSCSVPHSLAGLSGAEILEENNGPHVEFCLPSRVGAALGQAQLLLPSLFTAKSLLPPRCPLSLGSKALPKCPGGPSSLSTHSSNPVTTTGDIPGPAANGVKRNRMSQGPAQPPAPPGPLPGLDRLGVGVRGQEGRGVLLGGSGGVHTLVSREEACRPCFLLPQGLGVRLTQGCPWKDSPGRGPGSWKPTGGSPSPCLSFSGGGGGLLLGLAPSSSPSPFSACPPSLPPSRSFPLSSVHPPPLSGLPCSPGLHTLVSLILTCPFSLLCPPVFAFSITSWFQTSIPRLPSYLLVSLSAGSPGLPALTFLLPHRLAFPVWTLQVTCPQEPSSLGRALSSDSSLAPPPAQLTFN